MATEDRALTVGIVSSTPAPNLPQANSASRFIGQPILSIDGIGFLAALPNIIIPQSPSDTFHTVQAGEVRRLDIISFVEYGVMDYWWIIAIANGLYDLIADPAIAGVQLRIPAASTFSRIFSLLPPQSPTPGVYS